MDLLDRRTSLGLALLGLGVHVALRIVAGLWGAMGTDAALWGLTAMDLRVGAPPLVPPGYPALVAVGTLLGALPVTAGWCISLTCAALLPAAGFLAARAAGADRRAATVGAIAILALPDAGLWAQQVQPDALAALGLVGLAGALTAAARGSARWAWVAAVVAGLLPLVREHGTPAAALAILVLLWLRAWGPVGAAVAAWWLGPVVVGVLPGAHPGDVPWAARSAGAIAALTTTDPSDVPYVRELHHEARTRYLALVMDGDTVGRIRWHLFRSLGQAWDGWLLVLAAGIGAATARRRETLPVIALLLAALPALLIWSQRRHVLLLAPVAIVGLVVLARGRRATLGLAALALCGAARWPGTWIDGVRGLQSERFRAHHHARTADWLAANTPPGSFLGGVHQEIGLYHPMPRHDPDGSAADWRTWFVGDGPPAGLPGWSRVHDAEGALDVWQLEPERDPRPCADTRPEPDTPHLAVGLAHAELSGCSAD